MEMVWVLKKKPENKICSQMYEVFDLNEAYVVWKITIELNKSHTEKKEYLIQMLPCNESITFAFQTSSFTCDIWKVLNQSLL
jgi:hypothetical protein